MLTAFKRYGPLVGSAALVLAAVLRFTGNADLASVLSNLGGLLGSGIPAGEISAAVLAGGGLILKFISLYKDAVAGK